MDKATSDETKQDSQAGLKRNEKRPANESKKKEKKDYFPGYDIKLRVQISSIQGLFMNEFFLALQAYFANGLLKAATERAAQKAKKAIQNIQEEQKAKSLLFLYDVTMDNPLMFLPHMPISSNSNNIAITTIKNYLVIDLGTIRVCNRMFLSSEKHKLCLRGSPLPPRYCFLKHSYINAEMPMIGQHIQVSALNVMRVGLQSQQKSKGNDSTAKGRVPFFHRYTDSTEGMTYFMKHATQKKIFQVKSFILKTCILILF